MNEEEKFKFTNRQERKLRTVVVAHESAVQRERRRKLLQYEKRNRERHKVIKLMNYTVF